MTNPHAKAVEAAATKIYEALEGPIFDQDFKRQQRQAALATRMSADAITAYLAAMRAEGWVMVPVEPTEVMHDAAREWSLTKYGQGIGFDASAGCWAAMLKGAGDGQG